MEKKPRSRRVALTDVQAESKAGIKLIQAIELILSDGVVSARELQALKIWLEKVAEKADLPAIQFLKDEVANILEDGLVTDAELAHLANAALRVVPSIERERLKLRVDEAKKKAKQAAREAEEKRYEEEQRRPTEKQLRFIAALGGDLPSGATRAEASGVIDRLLANWPSGKEVPYPISDGQIRQLNEIGIPFGPRTSGNMASRLIESSKTDPSYAAVWSKINAQRELEAREADEAERRELVETYGFTFAKEILRWRKIEAQLGADYLLLIENKKGTYVGEIVEISSIEVSDGKKPSIEVEFAFPKLVRYGEGEDETDFEWCKYRKVKAQNIVLLEKAPEVPDCLDMYEEYMERLEIAKKRVAEFCRIGGVGGVDGQTSEM